MCIVRISHFLRDTGDIRITISTQPFADEGDYTDPFHETDCGCRMDQRPISNPADFSYPGMCRYNPPIVCQTHNCCMIMDTVTPCRWAMFMRKKEKYGLRTEFEPALENHCPNAIPLHTYFPVIDDVPRRDPWPVFPVEDVLWSDWPFEMVADPDTDPFISETQNETLRQLVSSHDGFTTMAKELFDLKRCIRGAVLRARDFLDNLEADMNNGGQVNLSVADNDMQAHLRILFDFEYNAAEKYSNLLRELSLCLETIGKYPGENETFTSPDGSFSISHRRLQLAGTDPRAILAPCDGPLKMCSKYEDRYNELRRRMRKRKWSVDDTSSEGESGEDECFDHPISQAIVGEAA